jgi:hypothetical protein
VQGTIIKETYVLEGAEVLAEYGDGSAAITRARYGKGTAILIGSYVALGHFRFGDPANGRLLAGLVKSEVEMRNPTIHGDALVRVDTLSVDHGEAMIILQNQEAAPVDIAVDLPGIEFDTATEIFDGAELRAATGSDGVTISMRLKAGEVRVYRA